MIARSKFDEKKVTGSSKRMPMQKLARSTEKNANISDEEHQLVAKLMRRRRKLTMKMMTMSRGQRSRKQLSTVAKSTDEMEKKAKGASRENAIPSALHHLERETSS
ncbi:hypothetical protein OIU79_002048 [Salix purpurea]|uniref:Uncharacterized protein n=1 Tax=Salix purpurea TaxID=77065 RepID=A0A9Q0ZHP9_SALPP|nr:hypothetical protein OIU79_002048 [Salix purpurea]